MAYPIGTLTLTGSLGVTSITDTYATHLDYLGFGGLRAVASTTERNAIPTERRTFGMVVTTEDGSGTFILANTAMGGTNNTLSDNGNWKIFIPADTGITDLNGLTATTQTFATGTAGTNFTIDSATSTHTFNLPEASASSTGKLTSTDWAAFDGKQNALSITNLTDVGTDGITITNGTGAVIGASAVTIAQAQSSASQNGYLDRDDWSTFNGKQNALSFTDLTANSAQDGISISNGTGAVIGTTDVAVSQVSASATQNGYLSSSDWTSFTNKGTGSVTSISAGTGLSTGGSPITTSGTIDFSDANVAAWAATPSSANLITAMTDEVGTGKLVFNGNPNFANITLDADTGINFDSTTGGFIGKLNSQKFGFWGATPIVQPTTAITADTFTSGVGTVLTDADTFGGYTLAQIAAILRTVGLAA
jgi:hypothetical protein